MQDFSLEVLTCPNQPATGTLPGHVLPNDWPSSQLWSVGNVQLGGGLGNSVDPGRDWAGFVSAKRQMDKQQVKVP